MQSRKAEDAAWQERKDTILDLYTHQGKPLKDVMRLMAEQGFVRTKSQYERILKSRGWAASKNIRSSEWQFIYRRLRERNAREKKSVVKVRGTTISKARLNKEERRQGYLTTHQKHVFQYTSLARAATPPGIEVHTPPQSPSTEPETSQRLYQNEPLENEESSWWQDLNLLRPSIEGESPHLGLLMTGISAASRRKIIRELRNIGNLHTKSACQLALMCAGITIGITEFVEHMLYQMISNPAEAMPRQCAIRVLILAIQKRLSSLVSTFLRAGISAFDRISLGSEELFDLDEHYMFWHSVSAFEVAVQYRRYDILGIIASYMSKRPHACQEAMVQKQLGAAHGSAICTDDSRLRKLVAKAGLRLHEIDQIMDEEQYIQRRLHSSLQQAAEAGDMEEMECLLQKGAPANHPSPVSTESGENWTPLHVAARQRRSDIVKLLLRAGANANAISTGCSALQVASENGDLTVVRILLASKADVNFEGSAYGGRTAIERAATNGHLSTVVALLTHGADITGRDSDVYRKSVYRAWTSGHHHLVHVLESWKLKQSGSDDCEAAEDIVASMLLEEQEYEKHVESESQDEEGCDYDIEGEEY